MNVHIITVARPQIEGGVTVGEHEVRFVFADRSEMDAFRSSARAEGWSTKGMTAPAGVEVVTAADALASLAAYSPTE